MSLASSSSLQQMESFATHFSSSPSIAGAGVSADDCCAFSASVMMWENRLRRDYCERNGREEETKKKRTRKKKRKEPSGFLVMHGLSKYDSRGCLLICFLQQHQDQAFT
jgi:hypothetical protein